jgi:hypothetical protein
MPGSIESLTDLMNLLKQALSNPAERVVAIKTFQSYVFERTIPISGANAEQWQILNDLAFDLNYYEPKRSIVKKIRLSTGMRVSRQKSAKRSGS